MDPVPRGDDSLRRRLPSPEDALGMRLFLRHARGVEPTGKGRLHYPILRNALDAIAEGTAMVTKAMWPRTRAAQGSVIPNWSIRKAR